jgi:hypothetical protein
MYYPKVMPWFFETDYGVLIWTVLPHRAAPSYRTNERKTTSRVRDRSHPPLVGYHLFVSVIVVICGASKAILTYYGDVVVPNTLDWIFVVVIGNGYVCPPPNMLSRQHLHA